MYGDTQTTGWQKQKKYGAKYGNEENLTEKLKDKKDSRRKYTSTHSELLSKKCQIGKFHDGVHWYCFHFHPWNKLEMNR